MVDDSPARMGHPAESVTPPSSPPIYQTTAFDLADLQMLADLHSGTARGDIYTRDSNPNHSALSESVAALEHAEAGAVFASGMGAISATLMTFAGSGDHVIVAKSLYGITIKLLRRLERQFGISITQVDACNEAGVAAAVRENTKLCFVETVSNPLLEVVDPGRLADALGDVPLVIDSTFTTPELIRPVEHGARVVIHSASKYLNGHGDVMLGVVAGNRKDVRDIRATSSTFGQNANPFESWLTQRGLRTLPLRMRHICQTTGKLAAFLESHDAVRRVYHPTLASHPTSEVARRLYPGGTGGIVSFELREGGRQAVNRLMQAVPGIPFSATLADARTTFSHPATTSHGFMSRNDRLVIGITDELVRISVGLEDADLLMQELNDGLNRVFA